jgi:CelD/BcsL family acetyltransferase involved in cellulose biosynthesis/predicted RNA methylase
MITETLEISREGLPSRLRAEWQELLTRIPHYSMAQTPTYCELAMQMTAERGGRAYLVAVRREGGLVGLWPLTLMKEGLLNVIRPASCGTNEEYSGPLVAPSGEADVLAAILRRAMSLKSDILYLYNVPQSGPLASLLAAPPFSAIPARQGTISGYSLALSKYRNWEEYLAHSSSSHRKGLRNDMRRLSDLGDVSIGTCETPQAVQDVLRAAFAAKREWAKARRLPAAWLDKDEVLTFFTRLAERLDLASVPLVSFLALGGKPVAAEINLIGNRSFEFFFTAFDQGYHRYSPGQILIDHNLQWAQAHGLDFDFRILRAGYKEKLSDTVTSYATHMFLLSRKARILNPLLRQAWRLVGRSQRVIGRLKQNPRLFALKSVLGGWRRRGRYLRHRLDDMALNIKTLDGPVVKVSPVPGGTWYESLSYPALKAIEHRLPMNAEDVLLDLGAGMGTVICYFARRPVRQVLGVEVDQRLASMAASNLERLRGKKAGSATVHCGDARGHDYHGVTVIMMYNPFDRTIMRPVLEKLAASLREAPRRLRIVYANPVEEALFREFPQFKAADRFQIPYESGTMPVILYEAMPATSPEPIS